MAGKKKTNNLALPPRVHQKHGAFYYVHPDNRWERIGKDVEEARRRGAIFNAAAANPENTMAHYFDLFLLECEKRVKAKANTLSRRTLEDYRDNIALSLKPYFGELMPADVDKIKIGKFLDLGVECDRAIRVNREKACLSACFTWILRNYTVGVSTNPCFGVKRNPETKRERYATDYEYTEVYKIAVPQVRALMELIYRTLQRPSDILNWTRLTLQTRTTGRVLRFQQSKTKAWLEIIVSPEIDAALAGVERKSVMNMYLIPKRNGGAYTEEGISAMFRRYVVKLFGKGADLALYDLKAKGATDMWRSGVPLERIQALMGHESIRTTEIYVKSHWVEPIEANNRKISEGQKPV